MTTPNLTFNILTFNHPSEEYTFYFYKDESSNLQRIHKTLVPEEVIEKFGEQEHYYTSFLIPLENGFPVTKKAEPVFLTETTPKGETNTRIEKGSCFGRSVLKRYYNALIHNYFNSLGHLVKPNFVTDTEIWLHSKFSNDNYNIYQRFSIKVQIARITKMPELLITYEGKSKAFRQSVQVLIGFAG